MRAMKKKMQREGVFREMKQRRAYEKPSEKKARLQNESTRRFKKILRKKNAPNKSRFYSKPPRWFTCKTAGRRRTIHPHYRRGAKIAFARVHACAHMHKLANERKRKKKALRTKRKESPQTLRKLCRVRARTLTSVVPPMMMRTSASGTKYYRR